MIVLTIFSTLLAIVVTVFVFWANMMDPTPTKFRFIWVIWLAWAPSAVTWLAWAVDKWT